MDEGNSVEGQRELMLGYVERYAEGLVEGKSTKGERADSLHVVVSHDVLLSFLSTFLTSR